MKIFNPENAKMADQDESLQALSDLPAKKRALVHVLRGGKDFTSRMGTLGFTPGTVVTVIQNYGHGPVLVTVKDVRVALGRGEALKVLVEALPDEQEEHG
jgi:ferrous iron transport protein A